MAELPLGGIDLQGMMRLSNYNSDASSINLSSVCPNNTLVIATRYGTKTITLQDPTACPGMWVVLVNATPGQFNPPSNFYMNINSHDGSSNIFADVLRNTFQIAYGDVLWLVARGSIWDVVRIREAAHFFGS